MDAGTPPPPAPSSRRRLSRAQRWTLFATILASSMVFIDGSALNVALPTLQADLSAGGAELLWIVNAYLLMLASLILIGGALGDKLGRKKVFMAGIMLFMLASLACGLAPSTRFLIGFRVVQGAGGALMIPGSLAIIAAGFPADMRGRAYGAWAAVTTMVTVGGPVLGGVMADAGLWRGVFLINLPLAFGSLVILKMKVAESRDEEAPAGIDLAGALMATLGLGSMTYSFIRAPEVGFGDPWVAVTLALGALLLPLFIVNEYRSAHPMVPLKLFKSRTFSGANLLTLLLYGALSVTMFFLALNLIQVQGYSPTFAGIAFTPFTLALAATSPVAGRAADRLGTKWLLITGPAMTGLAMLLLGTIGLSQGSGDYLKTFFPPVLLFGLGMGLTVAPLTTAAMGSVATHQAGIASGVNNSISRLAGVMMVAVLGSLFLFVYYGSIEQRVGRLDLEPAQRELALDQASRLGAAEVPAALESPQAAAVAEAYDLAFVESFNLLMFISAAMAWGSSIAAALLIEKGRPAGTGD